MSAFHNVLNGVLDNDSDDWRKRIAMKTNDTAEKEQRQVIKRIARGWISQNAKRKK